MKRICIFWMAVLFLLCTGCSNSGDVPEESVVRLWSQWDSANSAAIRISMSEEEEDRRPCFSVENAEGQKLTIGKENAAGTMPLFSYSLGDMDSSLAMYAVPYSERYVIYFQQEQLSGSLTGYKDANVTDQYFSWDVTDAQQLEYQSNALTAVGVNMTYDFGIVCNPDEDAEAFFHISGQRESQVVLKQQEDYFLVKSEDSPCTLKYGKTNTPLGKSPAGQWSKISLVDGVWTMELQTSSFDE